MSYDKPEQERQKTITGAGANGRRERLAKALRANLTKRKTLARARASQSQGSQANADEPSADEEGIALETGNHPQ
jgi:hypothetical protein